MVFKTNGTLTTDKRTIDDAQTWDTQTDWEAYQSKSSIDITNGVLTLAELPASAISRWSFDDADTNAGTLVDDWGANDLTINGATTGAAGVSTTYASNEAYSFDEIDDYLTTTNIPELEPDNTSKAFTIAGWVYPDATDSEKVIAAQTTDVDGWFLRIEKASNNHNENELVLRTLGANTEGNGTIIPEAAATHFAVGWDIGTEVKTWKNGSPSATTALTDSGGEGAPFKIGTQILSGTSYFGGRIDDIRTYDKILSDAEVSSLYNTGRIS